MNEERPHRQEKIAELIHQSVGEIIKKELDFPVDILVTISGVELSPNHQHATIRVTVLPYEKQEEVIEVISKNIRVIQNQLNGSLRMRPVPKITFQIDDSEERARHILDILDKD